MTPWFPIALSVIVVGCLGLLVWLVRSGDRRAPEPERPGDDGQFSSWPAVRPGSVNHQMSADLNESTGKDLR